MQLKCFYLNLKKFKLFFKESEHDENSSNSSASHSSSSAAGTISDGEGGEDQLGLRLRQSSTENYWDMSVEQEKYYTEQFHLLHPDLHGQVQQKNMLIFN